MSAGRHESHDGVFDADPQIGGDLAQVDWAATPLGNPDQWPQSLQTAVSILLSTRFSMWMAWGPELTFFCNAAYRRDTLAAKYPWALGRPASEVWAEIWDDIGPRIDRVLSTGQATWDEALLLFLERSGYSEESYHTFSYSPLRDDDGTVVGILCVVSEDTERVISGRRMTTLRELGSDPSVRPSEAEMLDSAARQLEHNLNDLPFTLTYLFDDDGSARLVATSGITAGHPVAPAELPADAPGVWPHEASRRGDAVLVELTGDPYADLPTGAWPAPPTHALVVPLQQQGAAPLGFLVAALNRYRPLDDGYRGFVELIAAHVAAEVGSARSYRAEQRRAEDLAELDRAKTTFFSNISHEFRTPLTLILGPVADLRARAGGIDDAARHELDVVHRNGLRLAKLVNTLLDFSRIEAGRMQARYEPVDLAAVTAELASVFRSAVDRAGLDLVVDAEPLENPVYVDRDMWEKVVLNLLSNALKFTFDGAITVRVTSEGGEAVVTVADTGIGVAPDEMPRLFERFHRIETARARSNEGSGIGLALVKELVELHGGTISATSTPGAGTTFDIRLPFGSAHLRPENLAEGPTRTGSATADPYVQEALRWLPSEGPTTDESISGSTDVGSVAAPAPVSGPRARVLVADDNTDMREYLVRLLEASGYDVEAVGDGQQALEGVRAHLPDLVVSDVMMPRLDGLELVARLRADPRTAVVPVLLLSARAGQEASIEGLHAGADDYLVKPFAAAELLARVRANVELSRLRNHHARWRTALIDSLQEAFFVCDDRGAVIETNAAFADVLGYGADGLPYEPPHPWFPDAESDPEAYEQVAESFAGLLDQEQGTFTVPVTHRDGHRLWVTFTFNHAEDPDTGRRVMVGTFRDVTAEHYVVQRQTALAALNQVLAQADTVDEAVLSAAGRLHELWRTDRVLAVTFPMAGAPTPMGSDAPRVVGVGTGAPQWTELPPQTRSAIETLRDGDLLVVDASAPGSAGIALQHPHGVLVLRVDLSERRHFTAEDQTLLVMLAGRLGQGLHRVQQLDQQRETALALQHAILGPADLPAGFAVRYAPASSPLQVGGDWYDVVELDDGRIALIVGDCVGHGLAAATVMGQLRSACRALLLEQPSPSAALAALDRFAARLPGAVCTTAFCAVLDTGTGELTYSSAGHPPPVLVHGDRTATTLEDGRAIPLGLRPNRFRPESQTVLPPRATLLLYTDGLVERRRQPLDFGIARATDLVREGSALDLDELASDILSRLTPEGGYQDDVALLLYRQPTPLHLDFPASVDELAGTRTALRTWLTRADMKADQVQDVLIATGEAVANAIEHGHRNSPGGTVTLRATALADRVLVTVVDTGVWKTPRPDVDITRGRGVTLMKALMQDVSIVPDANGTTVHMYSRIAP
ncbi:histidine kinase [Mycolicibacterium madagascariense]|uniref:histidine kinase n=1 Tax=Mycolicibacterium madagascariense TaxID=212765 RepID=A0A7I7XH96_9MYCO|nr:SpoIIE family protein phosphatase [Mycolicibacterium madagascariense]MCV7011145.1 SpoIIE family protein phosphatase [Mycolicibacterium madagascariense]BBZ28465.1 histidine kinase [Mycolicibacterium madagascariense]